MRRLLLIFVALLCPLAHGTAYTVSATGNANSAGSFTPAAIPGVGDTITCSGAFTLTFTVNVSIGTSPASGNVITQSGSCIIALAQNVTLTVLGGWSKLGTVRRAAGSSIVFDSTGAASPTNTPYVLDDNGVWTDDGTHPPTNTTGNQFTITSNIATGTGVERIAHTAGQGLSGMNATVVSDCGRTTTITGTTTNGSQSITGVSPSTTPPLYKFGQITGPGIPTGTLNNPVTMNAVGSTITLSLAATASGTNTFNVFVPCWVEQVGGTGIIHMGDASPVNFIHTYGIYFQNNWTVNDGYSMDFSTHDTQPGGYSAFIPAYTTPTGGVVRTCTNCVLDTLGALIFGGATWSRSIFGGGWITPAIGTQATLGTLNDPIIRYADLGLIPHDGGQVIGSVNINRGLIEADQLLTYSSGAFQSPAPFATGTLTSTSSTVLTDSTASFPSFMHGDGSSIGYFVCINSTTATDRCRLIQSNTSTSMTLIFPFPVTVTPGATYTVYDGGDNPHFTSIGAVASGLTYNFEHVIGWFFGAGPNGDFFHAGGTANTTYNYDYTILLPNIGRDNSGTLCTCGGQLVTTAISSLTHNTYFTGHQSASFYEASIPAHTTSKFQSGIAWADPTVNYVPGGGAVGPYKGDVSVPPASTPADIIDTNCFVGGSSSCADYNAGWGVVPFSASGNANGYCSLHVAGCDPGYNLNSTVIMGAHDVNNVDPGWSNRWADPTTWGYSLGLPNSGDPVQDYAQVLNCMAKVNDPSGYNSACSPANFYAYIQTSFAPTAVAYHNMAADGTDIGAVPYMSPSVTNFTTSGAVKFNGTVVIQ